MSGRRPAPDARPAGAWADAASAVHGALTAGLGPEAADRLALAQAQLAWQETVAEGGLNRAGMESRLTRLEEGTAHVEASDPMLAQELRLRADALAWTVNRRMAGRPGAVARLERLAVSVGRKRH